MHLNSDLLFKKYATSYFKDNLKVLEIGGLGDPPYFSTVINNKTIKWYVLDIDMISNPSYSKSKFYIHSKDEYNYPIEDNKFDIVFSNQVLVNVKQIWMWMKELKKNT